MRAIYSIVHQGKIYRYGIQGKVGPSGLGLSLLEQLLVALRYETWQTWKDLFVPEEFRRETCSQEEIETHQGSLIWAIAKAPKDQWLPESSCQGATYSYVVNLDKNTFTVSHSMLLIKDLPVNEKIIASLIPFFRNTH